MSDRLTDNAADVYVHELARVDKLGPNPRLVFTLPDLSYPDYQNVQIKMILPAEYISTTITLLASSEGVDEKSSMAVLFLCGNFCHHPVHKRGPREKRRANPH